MILGSFWDNLGVTLGSWIIVGNRKIIFTGLDQTGNQAHAHHQGMGGGVGVPRGNWHQWVGWSRTGKTGKQGRLELEAGMERGRLSSVPLAELFLGGDCCSPTWSRAHKSGHAVYPQIPT